MFKEKESNLARREHILEILVAEQYFEETGISFWDLSPTEQRKEIENYKEDYR